MFQMFRDFFRQLGEPGYGGPYAPNQAQTGSAAQATTTTYYGGSDKMGAMSEQFLALLTEHIDTRSPGEAKAELAFIVSWIHDVDQGDYNDPNKWWGPQGIKWLLLHAYFGMTPTNESAAPWTKNELEPITRFYERAPEHLRALMAPLYDDFREICAIREEKKLIEAARRSPGPPPETTGSNGSSTGAGQSHADKGPTPEPVAHPNGGPVQPAGPYL